MGLGDGGLGRHGVGTGKGAWGCAVGLVVGHGTWEAGRGAGELAVGLGGGPWGVWRGAGGGAVGLGGARGTRCGVGGLAVGLGDAPWGWGGTWGYAVGLGDSPWGWVGGLGGGQDTDGPCGAPWGGSAGAWRCPVGRRPMAGQEEGAGAGGPASPWVGVGRAHQRARLSWMALVRAWPRWREPVTLGGGTHIMKTPRGLGSATLERCGWGRAGLARGPLHQDPRTRTGPRGPWQRDSHTRTSHVDPCTGTLTRGSLHGDPRTRVLPADLPVTTLPRGLCTRTAARGPSPKNLARGPSHGNLTRAPLQGNPPMRISARRPSRDDPPTGDPRTRAPPSHESPRAHPVLGFEEALPLPPAVPGGLHVLRAVRLRQRHRHVWGHGRGRDNGGDGGDAVGTGTTGTWQGWG